MIIVIGIYMTEELHSLRDGFQVIVFNLGTSLACNEYRCN